MCIRRQLEYIMDEWRSLECDYEDLLTGNYILGGQ